MLSAEPQREALSKGGQILSVPFLASPAVQRELNAIVSKGFAQQFGHRTEAFS